MNDRSDFEQFLSDIAPYFYRRAVTYVEVGSHDRGGFQTVLRSELMITEAHLFEPNQDYLTMARTVGEKNCRGRGVEYHALALGSNLGSITLQDSESMTRVIHTSEAPDAEIEKGEGKCDADSTTLDELATRFAERRISLLKIDADGYEFEVLTGAKKLFQNQRVDVLYVEVGLNPEGTQQDYYQRIEDALASHGYRLFRMYKQQKESEDVPLVVPRTSISFLSAEFAQSKPYQVTAEIDQANGSLDKLHFDVNVGASNAPRPARELKETRDKPGNVEILLSQVTADRDTLRAKLRSANRLLEVQKGALQSLTEAKRSAEKGLYNSFDCISKVHGREQYARGDALAARAEVARIRRSFSYRLGALLVTHGRSPIGWIKAPVGIIREFIVHRRLKSAASVPDAAEGMPTIVVTDERSMWVPITKKPQLVVAKCMDGDWDIWVTAHSPREGANVTIAVQTVQRVGTSVENSINQQQRHRDLMIRRIKLRSGVPTRLLENANNEVSFKLIREAGRFCILKVQLCAIGAVPAGQSNKLVPEQALSTMHGSITAPRVDKDKFASTSIAGTAASSEAISDTDRDESRPKRASKFSASELESKLFGGFARYAIPELEELKTNARTRLSERRSAAWALTRWFYVEENIERALENIAFAGSLGGSPQAHFLLAEGQCLVKQGRYEAADVVLGRGMSRYERPDFQLLQSTVVRHRELEKGRTQAQAETAQLNMLNGLMSTAGLSPLRKARLQDPLHLSNITAVAESARKRQSIKVSTVIPAYNAGDTLEWVVASLLQQTWRNLEVIVVDDCSTDDTCEVVKRIARSDPRVKLVQQERNCGAYTARNVGLQHASGDLITVHDSDDWSHPQRLELQIDALESDHSVIATMSHWVRVSENLDVIGAWIPKGSLIDLNFSSLLFRRELLDVLGIWDEVLVSGDAEFYSRLKRLYGAAAVVKVPRHKLLAFSLTRESSLTRSKATHLRSLYYGLRGSYRDSYLYWHSRLGGHGDDLPLYTGGPRRNFPVPPKNLPHGKKSDGRYDVVVISDLAMRGGAFVSTLNYIIAACKAGKKTAVFHWRRFDLVRDVPLQDRFYEACIEYDVDILVPGDSIDADLVLVGYPTILKHRINPMPEFQARQLVIVVNQYASRLIDGQDQQYDPLQIREHLCSIFGKEGVWVPISAWVQRLMQEDRRYPAPHSLPWYPMIEVESWCTAPIQWRGSSRQAPVIGRHGRDTYTKWPASVDALAQAYGVGQDWEVRFLGGAQHATGMLGGRPANWSIIPFDDVPVEEFLRDLDFYVHYPHEKYIEEFGRGVMEAMAFGVPVILPFQFKETFGSAATYARPEEISKVISELWRSQEHYLERARAGRSFVLENCSLSTFPDRLAALPEENQVGGRSIPTADSSTAAGQ